MTNLALDIPRIEKTWHSLTFDTLNQIEARTQAQGIVGVQFGIRSLDIIVGEIPQSTRCDPCENFR